MYDSAQKATLNVDINSMSTSVYAELTNSKVDASDIIGCTVHWGQLCRC